MNVYVIYKFDDKEEVLDHIDRIKKEVSGLSFFCFIPGEQVFWRNKAKKKIKNCDMVVFFDNRDDYKDTNCGNIKWELSLAAKYKKRIVIFKKNLKKYASELYDMDYSDKRIDEDKYHAHDVNDAPAFFKAQAGWTVSENILNAKNDQQPSKEPSFEEKRLLLEQYKIMIDTSEKLMERRQSMVNLYITICTALIAFIGASFAFGDLLITSVITLLTGVMTIILCYNWRSSLGSYELNNEGKFEVINQIEKHLPADMFECEYRYNKMKGIRSYSTREKMLPVIFMFVGVGMIILSGLLFFIK